MLYTYEMVPQLRGKKIGHGIQIYRELAGFIEVIRY